jgi:5-methylcytosine-specific restriction endonuclease McrA
MDENTQKLKRGDRREDGMIFWKKKCGIDLWYSEERFKEEKAKQQRQSKEYYENNKFRLSEYTRVYVEKNAESKKQYWREYAQKNKEKKKAYIKKYRIENTEKLFLYKQKNKEKIAARKRQYSIRNPGIIMELKARSRARRKNAARDLTNSQKKINRQIFLMAKRLKQCTKIDWHVDHIIPISRGGLHVPSNLMPLPAKLNLRKHAKTDTGFNEWTKREELILKP